VIDLSQARLVYIAPRAGESGVGDYADEFIDAVRPHFGETVELRHRGPGWTTLWQLVRQSREVHRIVRDSDRHTIVHTEQSGGALLPFWGPFGLRDVQVTSTVHDPPLTVWWPFRTRLAARIRVLGHGIHYTLRRPMVRLEAKVNRGRTLVALSRTGARELALVMKGSTIASSSLFVPKRPDLDPVNDRPMAIGLFGYVYRGKGFDVLADLREHLDPQITIRIAGRGTEELPPLEGVEILGEVLDEDEDAFFNSIRVLLVPYNPRHIYGREAFPAASTVSRAMAYRTPVLCRGHGSLRELAEDGGALVVDGGAAELAAAANELLSDAARLAELQVEADRLRTTHSAERVIDDYLQIWRAG
jgi:glycosyltransferase involved in cell wall biosynthesis